MMSTWRQGVDDPHSLWGRDVTNSANQWKGNKLNLTVPSLNVALLLSAFNDAESRSYVVTHIKHLKGGFDNHIDCPRHKTNTKYPFKSGLTRWGMRVTKLSNDLSLMTSSVDWPVEETKTKKYFYRFAEWCSERQNVLFEKVLLVLNDLFHSAS